jgi:hypothetical protein
MQPSVAGALVAADLTVGVEVTNWGASPAAVGILSGRISRKDGSIVAEFSQPYSLAGGVTALLTFSALGFPQLSLAAADLWWPWQMGSPTQHVLTLNVTVTSPSGKAIPSDSLTTLVGLRQSAAEIDAAGHLQYAINGFRFLIRGAGWSPDVFLRDGSPGGVAWTASALAYTRDMGLNTIRLEVRFSAGGGCIREPNAGLLHTLSPALTLPTRALPLSLYRARASPSHSTPRQTSSVSSSCPAGAAATRGSTGTCGDRSSTTSQVRRMGVLVGGW